MTDAGRLTFTAFAGTGSPLTLGTAASLPGEPAAQLPQLLQQEASGQLGPAGLQPQHQPQAGGQGGGMPNALAESIARNIAANMAVWAQNQVNDAPGLGPATEHDRQTVEAVARAAAAAAAAAATAVISAAGEAVQQKIHERAMRGFLPFLITDLSQLVSPFSQQQQQQQPQGGAPQQQMLMQQAGANGVPLRLGPAGEPAQGPYEAPDVKGAIPHQGASGGLDSSLPVAGGSGQSSLNATGTRLDLPPLPGHTRPSEGRTYSRDVNSATDQIMGRQVFGPVPHAALGAAGMRLAAPSADPSHPSLVGASIGSVHPSRLGRGSSQGTDGAQQLHTGLASGDRQGRSGGSGNTGPSGSGLMPQGAMQVQDQLLMLQRFVTAPSPAHPGLNLQPQPQLQQQQHHFLGPVQPWALAPAAAAQHMGNVGGGGAAGVPVGPGAAPLYGQPRMVGAPVAAAGPGPVLHNSSAAGGSAGRTTPPPAGGAAGGEGEREGGPSPSLRGNLLGQIEGGPGPATGPVVAALVGGRCNGEVAREGGAAGAGGLPASRAPAKEEPGTHGGAAAAGAGAAESTAPGGMVGGEGSSIQALPRTARRSLDILHHGVLPSARQQQHMAPPSRGHTLARTHDARYTTSLNTSSLDQSCGRLIAGTARAHFAAIDAAVGPQPSAQDPASTLTEPPAQPVVKQQPEQQQPLPQQQQPQQAPQQQDGVGAGELGLGPSSGSNGVWGGQQAGATAAGALANQAAELRHQQAQLAAMQHGAHALAYANSLAGPLALALQQPLLQQALMQSPMYQGLQPSVPTASVNTGRLCKPCLPVLWLLCTCTVLSASSD